MTDRVLQFTVFGTAIPKGSGRALISKSTGRAIFKPDNPRTKDWQGAVTLAAHNARVAAKLPVFDGPVFVAAVFYLPRPKALLTKRKAALPIPHVKKPDADKLARSLCDSLTVVVWTDDAQVTDMVIRKRYCAAGDPPRAEIRVRAAHAGGLYAD